MYIIPALSNGGGGHVRYRNERLAIRYFVSLGLTEIERGGRGAFLKLHTARVAQTCGGGRSHSIAETERKLTRSSFFLTLGSAGYY